MKALSSAGHDERNANSMKNYYSLNYDCSVGCDIIRAESP